SPPVTSTRLQSNRAISASTSSSERLFPSWNAYGVSHHEQRRSQAVRRTKTHGRPAYVDSPWTEWKISLMVSIRAVDSQLPKPNCQIWQLASWELAVIKRIVPRWVSASGPQAGV